MSAASFLAKAWKAVKGAANVATGGTSSLYLYGGLLLAGAALMAAGAISHGNKVEAARSAAWSAGATAVRAEWLAADNAALREHQREIARLSSVVNNLNEVYSEQIETIRDLSDRLRAGGMRVTKAERDAAIASGTSKAVRDYATTAADHFAACRAEYVDLGQGYAGCAAVAQVLNSYATEVSGRPSRPSAPTPPTPPSRP